jgi:hypothetical protein
MANRAIQASAVVVLPSARPSGWARRRDKVSTTTVRLLQAAAEIAGSNRALAQSLGISEALLARFMTDSRELPDALLLRAVDVILEDRRSRLPFTSPREARPPAGDGAG